MATPKGISITAVSQRTGVSADLIRIWERRYAAIEPGRSGDGRRTYLESDVEKISLLRDATQAGHRIGEVAQLNRVALRKLITGAAPKGVRADVAQAPRETGVDVVADLTGGRPELIREALLVAIRALDASRLEDVLHLAALRLDRRVLVDDVMLPVLQTVGELWQVGQLSIAHEHLASAMVRSFLSSLHRGGSISASAPHLLVSTPAGELHELGALSVSLVSGLQGWRATYLGPNLPAKDIVSASITLGVRAVALSVVCGGSKSREELTLVARDLPAGTALIVGGAGAPNLRSSNRAVDVFCLGSLDEFSSLLDRLARHAAAS